MAKKFVILILVISISSNFASAEWCTRDKSISADIIESETANPVEERM